MNVLKRLVTAVFFVACTAAGLAAQATPGQTGFTPVDQLPPTDQLPSAPLLVAAYAFVWLAVFVYVWTVWRRLNKVERDMQTLQRRQAQRGQAR